MPRKKGNKQSNETITTPVILAKCHGCQVSGQLTACDFCQYAECAACIKKHRQADKLSHREIDSLRQQTALKDETFERSREIMITSLDLLKSTKDVFERTLMTEYDAYEQKLKQSQTINKQHIDDLKHIWIELEEKTTINSIEDCEQVNHMIDEIEASLTKKHIELCFQPNESPPSLGSLEEFLSDSISLDLVETKEQVSSVQSSSSSSNSKIANEKITTSEFENTSLKQTKTKNIANTMLIWLDPNIHDSSRDLENCIALLRSIINSIATYTDIDECVDFVQQIKDEQVFIIVSGSLSEQLIPKIEKLIQLHSIYILCGEKAKYEELAKQYKKLKGIFIQMESICDQLKEDVHQTENDLIPISIITSAPITNLNTLDQSFMYSQLVKEIILDDRYDANAKKELANFCRPHYVGNDRQLQIITEFENHYDDSSPIWWYTRECFTYMMLNKALRTQDLETIMKMAFFIQDIHRQLEQLQWQSNDEHALIVYRGQGMLNAEFEKLTKNQGGLFSFNNFLSTSTKKDVSMTFARRARTNVDFTGILFQMTIDPTISSIPFASLDQISYYSNEKEILFSMHTVFRIGQIKQVEDRLWQVELTLTSDEDQQLKDLTDYIRKEIGGGNGWQRMGILMFKMGELDKATKIYRTLMEQTSNANEEESAETLATTYNNTALTHQNMGQYSTALLYFEKALEIKRRYYSPNEPSFAITYNNMGMVHHSMGNFATAQSYHEKAIEIWQKSLPPDHPSLAAVYSNLGAVHESMANYSIALSYCEKALEIWKKSLPSNHPELATIYDNIGTLHQAMENYPVALSYMNKARDIREKSLPPNHPELGKTYSNLGTLYQYLGKYTDALSQFEKALEIQQKSLSPIHPDLATTYNNIGVIHVSLNDNSTAISNLQKALEIQQKSLPSDHVDLARTYINIGMAQEALGNFLVALSYYEKTLDIWQKGLPPNHPWMANIYTSMATLHIRLGRIREAIAYAERGVVVARHAFGPDHLRTKTVQFFLDQFRRQS